MGRPTAVRASAASHPGPSFAPCDDDGMDARSAALAPKCSQSVIVVLWPVATHSLSRREGATTMARQHDVHGTDGTDPLGRWREALSSSCPFETLRPRPPSPWRGPAFPTEPRPGARPRSHHASRPRPPHSAASLYEMVSPLRPRNGGLHVPVARNCQQAAGRFLAAHGNR